jgi:hypothetical protein
VAKTRVRKKKTPAEVTTPTETEPEVAEAEDVNTASTPAPETGSTTITWTPDRNEAVALLYAGGDEPAPTYPEAAEILANHPAFEGVQAGAITATKIQARRRALSSAGVDVVVAPRRSTGSRRPIDVDGLNAKIAALLGGDEDEG